MEKENVKRVIDEAQVNEGLAAIRKTTATLDHDVAALAIANWNSDAGIRKTFLSLPGYYHALVYEKKHSPTEKTPAAETAQLAAPGQSKKGSRG